MNNPDNYIVRGYRTGDEEGITSLFREVFEKEITIEQWNWKYFIPGNGRVYSKVVVDNPENIVGYAGAVPLRGIFQDKPLQFFQIADVMVHPKARGFLGRKNVFDNLMKALFEDIRKEFSDVFCYGFPGRRPFIIGQRVKVYDRIEQGTDCIKSLKHSFLNFLTVKSISWGDNRLDALWANLSGNFPLSLIRDKDYLHWRYAANPFFSYQLLGIFLLKQLKGWAVIRDSGEEVLVVDLLTEPQRCMGVLNALENYLIDQKKKTIRLWLPERWRKGIRRYSTKETGVVVSNMIWKMPIQTHVVRENLFYTMGDVDIF